MMTNWAIDEEHMSDLNKKMLAQMLKISNIVTMQTKCYSFEGHLFRLKEGASIGLRGSVCLEKVGKIPMSSA